MAFHWIELQTQLPTPAERAVDADQAQRDVTLRGREPVLLLNLCGLEVEDAVEVDRSRAILGNADFGGGRGGGHAAGEILGLLARLDKTAQGDLCFTSGREYLRLICRDELLEPAFL